MKKFLGFFLLGSVFYCLFLVVTLPAKQALGWVPKSAQLTAAGVSGTVWTGKAELLTVVADQKPFMFNNVRWIFNRSSLLQLAPATRFSARYGAGKITGKAILGTNSIEVVDTSVFLPSAEVTKLTSFEAPDLRIKIASLAVVDEQLSSAKATLKFKHQKMAFTAKADVADGKAVIQVAGDPSSTLSFAATADLDQVQPVFKLSAVRFIATAQELFKFLPDEQRAPLQGVSFNLDVDLPSLQLNPDQPMPVTGVNGAVLINNAVLTGATKHIIGNHKIALSVRGRSIVGRISSAQQSPLKLAGTISIIPRGNDRYQWQLNMVLDDSNLAARSRPFIQQLYSAYPKQQGQPNKRVINANGVFVK